MPRFLVTVGADFRSYLNFDIDAETALEANEKAAEVVLAYEKTGAWPVEFGQNTFGSTQWDDPSGVELVDIEPYNSEISELV